MFWPNKLFFFYKAWIRRDEPRWFTNNYTCKNQNLNEPTYLCSWQEGELAQKNYPYTIRALSLLFLQRDEQLLEIKLPTRSVQIVDRTDTFGSRNSAAIVSRHFKTWNHLCCHFFIQLVPENSSTIYLVKEQKDGKLKILFQSRHFNGTYVSH